MDTHFAPAERADDEEIATEIEIVSKNPFVSGLLHSISGLLAVLDEHRQIVALNDSFLRMLGITDPGEALGLRPGEVLQCIHAQDEPGGCGTTEFCSSCGAAVAIVSSLGEDKPVERLCALSSADGNEEVDLALLVRSHPIRIGNRRFVLLFLHDVSQQQQRAALERTFFHDVNNMLTILVAGSELLLHENPSKRAQNIHKAALRLHEEIAIQRCLMQREACGYEPMRYETTPRETFSELQAFFENHPVAHNRTLEFRDDAEEVPFFTDISLVSRVLSNMIMNALEATPENGVVKVWAERGDGRLWFCVWNAQEIPQEIAGRVFQRNFSTKGQAGRGIGTFSMKLFGEKILGGKVAFTSSPDDGTVFRFSLPL